MFDTNSLAQKLSGFQISNIMNFCERIQNLRKSLKIALAKICAFKILIITNHQASIKEHLSSVLYMDL